jgi:hypothetical protein
MVMYKKTVVVAVIGLFLMVLPAWGLDMTPGKYEITTKVEMQGMPGGMPAQTTTQCLTQKDPVPSTSAEAQGCKITNMKTVGNTVTYTMACDQQGMKTESTGTMTFKGETFEGKTVMKMGPSAGGMTVTTKISGKRIAKV